MKYLYHLSILGGTFDRLHIGHQKLIDTAFDQSERVIIGITKPALYKNKLLSEVIESYEVRGEAIKKYLEKKDYLKRTKIIPIEDIFGNTLTEKSIEAIFVTEENLPNVTIINNKRREINFPELQIITVPYIEADDGKIITSERIRLGEIERDGKLYENIFQKKSVLIMPEDLREELRNPLGTVVSELSEIIHLIEKRFLITVGDVISKACKDVGHEANISIIDFRTRRHTIPFLTPVLKLYSTRNKKIVNKPGTINKEAVAVYRQQINKFIKTKEKQTVIVKGEEDLLALPAILFAPLESIVLYGQYDMGIVVNEVTEQKKKEVETLLKKFI